MIGNPGFSRLCATILVAWFVSIPNFLHGAEQKPVPEQKTVRLAIGTFFAPPVNDGLRSVGQMLPELLMAELSKSSKFHLVERERIQTVWNELNLTAAGLTARENVAKLGHMLACDWLVSGTLVQAEGRVYIWTKVIRVRDGVVMDLNVAPYEKGAESKTVAGIAAFLEKAGTSSKGREFIAMGPFVHSDLPLDVKREDWASRLKTLMEKSFLERGLGVTEMRAVGPIFEERRLETAGLTGREGQVELQAAFWLVDGECFWMDGEPAQLSVGLRVQRVGGPTQMFQFTNKLDGVEKELLATLTRALANTNLVPTASPNSERDLLVARSWEMAERRSPFVKKTCGAVTITDEQMDPLIKQWRVNRDESMATYKRILLNDPRNLQAVAMLGRCLLVHEDPEKRKEGKRFLEEMVATKDPGLVIIAQRELADADKYARNTEAMEKLEKERRERVAAQKAKAASQPPPAPVVWGPAPKIPEESADEARLREFVQKNFEKFVPVKFERDPKWRDALLQYLRIKGNTFDHAGKHYCGFRFTVPEWIDGDFKLMHLLAKTEAQKDFVSHEFGWNIVPKSGRMAGFTYYQGGGVKGKELEVDFPYTTKFFALSLSKEHFKPGEEYGVWFRFAEGDLPDIAFAITIDSARGAKETGPLPLDPLGLRHR